MFEGGVELDAENGCDEPSEPGEGDMDAHILAGAFLRGEIEVAEGPGEGAPTEGGASDDGRQVEQLGDLVGGGEEIGGGSDDEDPGMDRAEPDDMDAVEQACPEWYEQGHNGERDGVGDDDAGVSDAEAVPEHDGDDGGEHEVADADEHLAEHEGAEAFVIGEDPPEGNRIEGGGAVAFGRALFGGPEDSAASDTDARISPDADEPDTGEEGRDDVEGLFIEFHGLTDEQTGKGDEFDLDGGDFSGDAGAGGGWVVGCPDGGADGDDASNAEACGDDEDDEHVEPGCGSRNEGHGRDKGGDGDLQPDDEADFVVPVAQADPDETDDVGQCGCGSEGGDSKVEDGRRDDIFEGNFGDDPDDRPLDD